MFQETTPGVVEGGRQSTDSSLLADRKQINADFNCNRLGEVVAAADALLNSTHNTSLKNEKYKNYVIILSLISVSNHCFWMKQWFAIN